MEKYKSNIDIANEQYNEARKQILMKLDKDIPVSNLELGFYDLTTYYTDVGIDSSLGEKILFYQSDKRRIKHIKNKTLYFTPEQIEALSFIDNNDRVIISAPTSFGKTLIVKEYIYNKKFNKIDPNLINNKQ